jgi:hypothetical protein
MEWLRETTAIRGTQTEHRHGYLGGSYHVSFFILFSCNYIRLCGEETIGFCFDFFNLLWPWLWHKDILIHTCCP